MKTKKKILVALALVGCAILLVAGSIAGTMAYLTAKTESVTNTFTVGDIEIDLDESESLNLKVVPGTDITKDPKVTVAAKSESCWLFVKVEATNWPAYMTYDVLGAGWIELETNGGTSVYYREVSYSENNQVFKVLNEDKVAVSATATSADLEALEAAVPSLAFTAYAIQKATVGDAETAWGLVNPNP